jgi:hypothetical protein
MVKFATFPHGEWGNDPADWDGDPAEYARLLDEAEAQAEPANDSEPEPKAEAANDSAGTLPAHYVAAVDVDQSQWSRTWIVNKLLDAGRLYEIFGKWKSGKSLIGLDLAAHLSLGLTWSGRAVMPCVAIYIAGEAVEETQARLAAWRIRKRISGPMPFYIRKKPTGIGNVGLAEDLATEVKRIAALHPDLHPVVIVDTLARNLGPELKEDGEGMGAFGNNLQDIVIGETGCTAFVIHHSGHADEDRSRGGSQWHAVVDGSLKVAKAPDGIVTLDAGVMRSGAGGDRFAWKIEVQQLPGTDNFGAPIEFPVLYALDKAPPVALKASKNERQAVEIVAELEGEGNRGIGSDTVRARWRGKGYGNDKNCSRIIDACVKKCLLTRSASGYISTPLPDD